MRDKERKPDRRILKTKKAIRSAFADLISVKDIDNITIKELSDTADISRKTFYYYYDSVWSLVDDIQNELADTLCDLIKTIEFKFSQDAYSIIIAMFKDVLKQDYKLYRAVFYSNQNPVLTDKILEAFKKKIRETYISRVISSDEDADLALNFVLGGAFQAFRKWFKDESSHSAEDFIKMVVTLTDFGLKGLVDNGVVILK